MSSLRRSKDGSITYIQTTAPISPGSSGGGLFDADGRLIGITALKFKDSENLNFALPADWVRDLPSRRVDLLKRTIPDTKISERERELSRKERELDRREAAVHAAEEALEKRPSDAPGSSDVPGSALESYRKAAGLTGPEQPQATPSTVPSVPRTTARPQGSPELNEAVPHASLPSAPKRKRTEDNDALPRFALDVARQLGREMKREEYPRRALEEGAGGTAKMLLRISADGKLSDVMVASSSGNDELDQYARDNIANLELPRVPPEFQSRAFTVVIPVMFAVRSSCSSSECSYRHTLGDYVNRIRAKIKQRLVIPPGYMGNGKAIYSVTLLPSGGILDLHLTRSSGSSAFDSAVEIAIRTSAPLPVPSSPELFQEIRQAQYEFRATE